MHLSLTQAIFKFLSDAQTHWYGRLENVYGFVPYKPSNKAHPKAIHTNHPHNTNTRHIDLDPHICILISYGNLAQYKNKI